LQHAVDSRGLDIQVDSCGTAAWHAGSPADSRSVAVMAEADVDISAQRSRKIRLADFEEFDHILVMDDSNYRDVCSVAPDDAARGKVARLLDVSGGRGLDAVCQGNVPDPYYDSEGGFEHVREMVREAVEGWLELQGY